MKLTLFVIGLLSMIVFTTVRIVNYVHFNQDIGGYLERAGNANTIEIAKQQMQIAINNIEKEGLTSGYTSILYKTPDEDIGYWYGNLKAAINELEAMNDSASQLEKSNVLIKLRETLSDAGDKGKSELVVPDGISVYPHNVIFMIWAFVSILLMLPGCVYVISES